MVGGVDTQISLVGQQEGQKRRGFESRDGIMFMDLNAIASMVLRCVWKLISGINFSTSKVKKEKKFNF